MNLYQRTGRIINLFNLLESTPGRNDKEALIRAFRTEDEQLTKDLDYCLEVLDGRHKLGYTFEQRTGLEYQECALRIFISSDASIEQLIDKVRLESKTQANIERVAKDVSYMGSFIAMLVHRNGG